MSWSTSGREEREETNGDGIEKEIKHVVGLDGSFPIRAEREKQSANVSRASEGWRSERKEPSKLTCGKQSSSSLPPLESAQLLP